MSNPVPLEDLAGLPEIYYDRNDDDDEQTGIHAYSPGGDSKAVIETKGQSILQDVSPDWRWLFQPHEGPPETTSRRSSRASSSGFNPTRVHLKPVAIDTVSGVLCASTSRGYI